MQTLKTGYGCDQCLHVRVTAAINRKQTEAHALESPALQILNGRPSVGPMMLVSNVDRYQIRSPLYRLSGGDSARRTEPGARIHLVYGVANGEDFG